MHSCYIGPWAAYVGVKKPQQMLAVAVVKLGQESETLRFLKRKGIFPFGSECQT